MLLIVSLVLTTTPIHARRTRSLIPVIDSPFLPFSLSASTSPAPFFPSLSFSSLSLSVALSAPLSFSLSLSNSLSVSLSFSFSLCRSFCLSLSLSLSVSLCLCLSLSLSLSFFLSFLLSQPPGIILPACRTLLFSILLYSILLCSTSFLFL